MEDIVYDIILDVKSAKVLDTNYKMCQGDHGRIVLAIKVYDGTEEIQDIEYAEIIFKKANSAVVQGELEKVKTGFRYRVKGNELDCPGPVIADVKLKDSIGRASTRRFRFETLRDTEEGEISSGEPYIGTLDKIIDDARGKVGEYQADMEAFKTNNEQELSTWKQNVQTGMMEWQQAQKNELQTYQTEMRKNTEDWLATLQDQLDENTAASLQNQINAIKGVYIKDEMIYLPHGMASYLADEEMILLGTIEEEEK